MTERSGGIGKYPPRSGSPRRIQRRRTKGWRMPENTVSVCRPGKWGNPHPVGKPCPMSEGCYKCKSEDVSLHGVMMCVDCRREFDDLETENRKLTAELSTTQIKLEAATKIIERRKEVESSGNS